VVIRKAPPKPGGIRRTPISPRPTDGKGVVQAPADVEKAKETKEAKEAEAIKAPVELSPDATRAQEGAELDAIAGALGEERHLAADTHAGTPSGPMGLRFFAMQKAESLGVDEKKATDALEAADHGLKPSIDPDVAMLHAKTKLKGKASSSDISKKTPFSESSKLEGELVQAQGEAKLGATTGAAKGKLTSTSELEGGGSQKLDVGGGAQATGKGVKIDATGTVDRSTTLEDGAKVQSKASGGVKLEGGQVKVDAGTSAGVSKELEDGSKVDAKASGGLKLEGGQVKLDASLDAQRSRTTEEELEGGGKRKTTTTEKAKGSVASMNFEGERSTAVREERTGEDGAAIVDDGKRGVRGSFKKRSVEAFSTSTNTRTTGDQQRKRTLEGTAGLKGVKGKATVEDKNTATGKGKRRSVGGGFDGQRIQLQGEAVKLDRENAPDGSAREVQRGVEGKVEAHRLGFTAEGKYKTSDGEAGSRFQGAKVSYDATGLAGERTHGHTDADGDSRAGSEGLKVKKDEVGVTVGRKRTSRLSDSETLDTATNFDFLLGNRKASGAVQQSRTRSKVDDDGVLQQKSHFARLEGRLEAFREVADKGPVEGGDPALEGKHRIEVHQKVDGGGGAFLGQLEGGVGLFGGLHLAKGKEIRYRTHMDPDAAKVASSADEDRSLKGRARQKIVGASLLDNKVALPDLSRPETMKVHDEVVLQTHGSVRASLGAMAYGARVGVQAQVKGEFKLAVKKTGADEVELDVTPVRVAGMRATGGVVLADIGVGRVGAEALRQTFRFDLSTESGRAAYQRALKGELPGGLASGDVEAKADGLGAFSRGDLPDGVQRMRLEKLEVRETDVNGQVGWMFLRAGRTRSRRTTDHMVTDGEVSVNLHGRTRELKKKTLLSGTEARGVTGSLKAVTAFDDAGRKVETFDSLTLSADYSDDKVKGLELNKDVIRGLNEDFGLGLEDFSIKGKKGARAVSVKASLTPDVLERLGQAGDAEVTAVADARDASGKRLLRLRDEVAKAADPQDAARCVQDFVAREGASGMGQVLALAGAEQSLEVTTTSSDYDKPVADAKTLASRWADKPWTGDVSKKDLTDRYRSIRGAHDALEDGLLRLDDDPFFARDAKAKEALATQLSEQKEALQPLLDLSAVPHGEAMKMWQKLDRGWTTGTQQRLMDELVEQTGITRVEGGLKSARATHVETPSDDVHVRTKSLTERRLLTLFGDERTQVSASTKTVRDDKGELQVDQVRLVAEVYDEKSRFSEVNGAVDSINEAFGASHGRLGGRDVRKGSKRTITVESTLDGDALARLGALDAAAVARASEGAPSPRRLRGLAAELGAQKNAHMRARVVEEHVQAHGLEGMGDVHRLAGGAVVIEASTDAYARVAKDAASVAAQFKAPLAAGEKNATVAARFKAVAKASEQLERAGELLESDQTLTPEQRQEEKAKLDEASKQLDGLLETKHLSHTDAAGLVAQLEGGWTSKHEQAAIDTLRADAGLLDVASRGGVIVAEAERPGEDGTRFVVSRREQTRFASGDEALELLAERAPGDSSPLLLRATFKDTQEKDGELSGEVVARLNSSFGLALDERPTRGDGGAREVTVSAELDNAALGRIGAADETRQREVATRAGIDPADVAELVRDMRAAPDAEARARVVQRFVGSEGLAGMGVAHQLASPRDGAAPPSIQTKAAGYDAALVNADEALVLYGGRPLVADATRGEVLGRAALLSDAFDEVKETRARVAADPLLTEDERRTRLAGLDERADKLESAADLSHLDAEARDVLAARVRGGWDGIRHRGVAAKVKGGALV
jgi:hypothetical protein